MSWKNWPSWLKGGLKGMTIGIVIALISFILSHSPFIYLSLIVGYPWNYIFYYTILPYTNYSGYSIADNLLILGSFIGIIINSFIIGAVIVLIYKDIKGNKR